MRSTERTDMCSVGSSKRREEPLSSNGNGGSYPSLSNVCNSFLELPKSKKRRIVESDDEEVTKTNKLSSKGRSISNSPMLLIKPTSPNEETSNVVPTKSKGKMKAKESPADEGESSTSEVEGEEELEAEEAMEGLATSAASKK